MKRNDLRTLVVLACFSLFFSSVSFTSFAEEEVIEIEVEEEATEVEEEVTEVVEEEATDATRRVSEILIEGNINLDDQVVLNELRMREGDVFETRALNQELRRLYATGYFDDVFVETEEVPDGVKVVFTVQEKSVIKSIKFEGDHSESERDLMQLISSEKGSLLDEGVLSRDVREIRNHFLSEGFSHAEVSYDLEKDPETGEAIITFRIDEGDAVFVSEIEFEGNEHFTDRELRRYMETQTKWWFFRRGVFDERQFNADVSRIRSVYRSEGYLDAEVEGEVRYSDDKKELHLLVKVDEGKEYLTGEISIVGELEFPEEKVREVLDLETDDAFNFRRIREDSEAIRQFYYDRGHMDVRLDVSHEYNAATDRMDLTYHVDAGEEIFVGRINIRGNTKTRDHIIRREIRLYPGEKYDGKKLRRSKQRIYDLGYFEDVFFDTSPTDRDNVKDLDLTVKETKTGEFSFGGGYSSVDAFLGFVQIRQRNFDFMNFPTFTGGGQDFIVRGELGSARANYLLSWTDPWILGYPYLFGFDIYRDEQRKFSDAGYDYEEIRTGGALRLGKDLTDQLSTGLKYSLERVEIGKIDERASQAIRDEEGKNMLSRIQWSMTLDTRDNRHSPTKGWYSGFTLENAGGFIGGDRDFVKGYVHTSYHYSIIENVVLQLRARGGMAESYSSTDKVPIYERFFAGGATTIRGYEQRSVGPRDPDDNSFAVGGKAMAIGNAEVSFPLFRDILRGALFYDVGIVGADHSDIFELGDYKSGAGVGVRVRTPIGPVRLDYGYPLNENHDDKRKGHFYFSVSHGF